MDVVEPICCTCGEVIGRDPGQALDVCRVEDEAHADRRCGVWNGAKQRGGAVTDDGIEFALILSQGLLGVLARRDVETLAVQLGRVAGAVEAHRERLLQPDVVARVVLETVIPDDRHRRVVWEREERPGIVPDALSIVWVNAREPEPRGAIERLGRETEDVQRALAMQLKVPVRVIGSIGHGAKQDGRVVAEHLRKLLLSIAERLRDLTLACDQIGLTPDQPMRDLREAKQRQRADDDYKHQAGRAGVRLDQSRQDQQIEQQDGESVNGAGIPERRHKHQREVDEGAEAEQIERVDDIAQRHAERQESYKEHGGRRAIEVDLHGRPVSARRSVTQPPGDTPLDNNPGGSDRP